MKLRNSSGFTLATFMISADCLSQVPSISHSDQSRAFSHGQWLFFFNRSNGCTILEIKDCLGEIIIMLATWKSFIIITATWLCAMQYIVVPLGLCGAVVFQENKSQQLCCNFWCQFDSETNWQTACLLKHKYWF